MISRIREQLGTAGLMVAVVALVAALAGGAYAASGGGLTGKQKKEVEKIAKKFAGKPGAPGVNGTNGTNGKDGAPGAAGKEGSPGAAGKDGTDGKSVEVGAATAGPTGECEAGGATVQIKGEPLTKKAVCNGEEGSPWTAGGTLPSEATETGVWRIIGTGEEAQYVPLGFPIPLSSADVADVTAEFVKEGEANPNCPGTVLNPLAKSQFLCVYGSAFATTGGNPGWISGGGKPTAGYRQPDYGGSEGVGPTGTLLVYEFAPVGATARRYLRSHGPVVPAEERGSQEPPQRPGRHSRPGRCLSV